MPSPPSPTRTGAPDERRPDTLAGSLTDATTSGEATASIGECSPPTVRHRHQRQPHGALAAALDVAAFARDAPELSLGLHLDLAEWAYAGGEWETIYERVDHTDADAVRSEVWRQIERFDQLYGHYPNYLDSHQHVHRSEPVLFDGARGERRAGHRGTR